MPSSADRIPETAPIVVGQTVRINAAEPLRLDYLEGTFTITKGSADLFAVRLAGDAIDGGRHHILRLEKGDLACGLPAMADTAVIVVAGLDTEIHYLPSAALASLAGPGLAPRLDDWILSMADSVFGTAPAWPELRINPGTEISCDDGTRLYLGRRVAWLRPTAGAFAIMGETIEAQGQARIEVPLAAAFHATALGSARAEIIATDALAFPDVEAALQRFYAHVAAGIGELIAAAESAAAEHLTLRDRINVSSMAKAVMQVARVAHPDLQPEHAATETNQIVSVFSAVALSLGCPAPAVPAAEIDRISISGLARAAGIGTRRVLLREKWWRRDNGPLIARRIADDRSVALLPGRRRGYRLFDGDAKSDVRVNAKVAAGLAAEGIMLYPPLPEAISGISSVFAFTLRGSRRDLTSVLAMGLFASVLASTIPLATGFLFESIVPAADIRQLAAVVAGLILAAIGAAGVELVKSIALVRLESRMEGLLQPAVMRRLLSLPVRFFRDYGVGDLTDRVLAVQRMRQLIAGTTVVSLLSIVFSVVSFIVILWFSQRLALLSAGLVAVAALTTAFLGAWQLYYERIAVRLGGQEDGLVIQLIQGIGKLRVSASESRLFAQWSGFFARRKSALVTAQRYAILRSAFYGAYPLLASILLFWVAASPTRATEQLALGPFLTVSTAFGQLLAAMLSAAGALTATLGAIPLFERLRPILSASPEARTGNVDPGPLTGEIEFSHVSFRYGPGTPTVLDDISFRTEPGQMVAIVGASGSGKSTMLRLLLGFETPESGDILYQGQSIDGLDAVGLRRRIGVVLQNARIQSGSIFENITGGLPYSLEAAWEAARMAGIAADIEAMPMGMHTLLIEGAVALSGGQAQRVMIARALVSKPQILIFDEATSALDSASQAVVIASLKQLQVTRIVIAHRLTTIKDADRILVLDRGHLVESGDFPTLMAKRGAFHALAQRQLL